MVQKKWQHLPSRIRALLEESLIWRYLPGSFRFACNPEHKKCTDKEKSHKAEQVAGAVLWQFPADCMAKEE